MPDRDLLRAVGEALYGPRWQRDLARDLGISDRHMRRMVAGYPIAPGIWGDLLALVERRERDLNEVREQIRARAVRKEDKIGFRLVRGILK